MKSQAHRARPPGSRTLTFNFCIILFLKKEMKKEDEEKSKDEAGEL